MFKQDYKEWKYFPYLKNANELEEYFNARISGHKEFFHYTTLKAINSILQNKYFCVSSVDRFNDKKDREQFGDSDEQKKYYSLCFTSGVNENLSLWYLYSGINGKGGRIGFTYNKLIKMIKECRFYLTEYDYFNHIPCGNKRLLKREDMQIDFRDVLYSRNDANREYASLKYNTMTNYGNMPVTELNSYKTKHIGFNKPVIWYYEKESRLLIKLIGEAEKRIKPKKSYAVLWELSDMYLKCMKIMCAPELTEESELKGYEAIEKFKMNTSRIEFSKNAGDVEMNICTRCMDKEERMKK